MTTACPWPTTVLVADEFIERMRQQLFSVRHRYQRDPMFPGWTFKDANAYDQTVLRWDDENGNFWLWKLTGNRTHDGYYQVAAWMD